MCGALRARGWLVLLAFLLAGGLLARLGYAQAYDPAKDPLVNPASMLQLPPEDRSRIATDDWFVGHLKGSPNTLTPIFWSSSVEVRLMELLFNRLFCCDANLEWMPNLDVVQSWQESEDHLVWTVKLKPGLKWHDGHPFTAHDVAYSWGEILDERVPCPAQRSGTDQIKQCVALDEMTVRFVHGEALPTAKWNMVFFVIPQHLFEQDKVNHPDLKTGEYYNRLGRHPVGNGPYRFVEWRENDKIVLERWEDYPGRIPYFKKCIFRIIPDSNMAKLAFEKGQIDEFRMSGQQFALEADTETFRRVGHKAWGSQWSFTYIGWNMDGSNPFFADKRVRLAMSSALDLPTICEKMSYNLCQPCLGIFHPDSWMFHPHIQPIPFDLQRAQDLLDAAGWRLDEETGWRTKTIDGEKTKLEFTLSIIQGSSSSQKIASIFQQDLRRLGVSMKVQTLEWASFRERIGGHEFQAEMAAWVTGYDPDMSWNLWHSEQYEKGRNYVGYRNPRVDELLEVGRRELDFEKRKKAYQEIHKIIYEDQPYTFVVYGNTLWGINKRIRGVSFSPLGLFSFYPAERNWWVPAKEQMRGMAP